MENNIQKRLDKKEVQKAWNRFLNDTYTNHDLSVILESLKNDDFQEFYEVSAREWDQSLKVDFFESKEFKGKYRIQADELLTTYEENKKHKFSHSPIRKITHFQKRYFVAAAVALLCLLIPVVNLFLMYEQQPVKIVQTVETSTGRGEMKTVFLPDHSKVTLNANSSIKYPAEFASNERMVELQGEALFDVTPNPDCPFYVSTKDVKVKVLGTVFDVKAYHEDNLLLVSVASGKVAVDAKDAQMKLTKGEQMKLDKSTRESVKLPIDAEKYLSWTEGTLYFNRTPIREVVNMINRHYPQTDIILSEGEYNNMISGEHDNKSVESVVASIIYSTGMKYKQEKDKIILYKD